MKNPKKPSLQEDYYSNLDPKPRVENAGNDPIRNPKRMLKSELGHTNKNPKKNIPL